MRGVQTFLILAWYLRRYGHFKPDNTLLWGAILCIVGYLAEHLASTPEKPILPRHLPNCNYQKPLQVANVPPVQNDTKLRITGLK